MLTPETPPVPARTLLYDIDEDLRHADLEYRLELGWTTTVHGGRLTLELDEDIWGLLMPTTLAVALATDLRVRGLSCLAVEVPDPTDQRSVLLIEPTDAPGDAPLFPASVSRLPTGFPVLLPPSTTAQGPVRWLVPHEPTNTARPSARDVADILTRLG